MTILTPVAATQRGEIGQRLFAGSERRRSRYTMKFGTPTRSPSSSGNRSRASSEGCGSTIRSTANPASANASVVAESGRRQKCWVTSTCAFCHVSLTSSVSN
jgi:hypothetical protein